METMNDGGPAHPITEVPNRATIHTGISVRDYFAGIALPWALANVDVSQPWKHSAAMAAYEIADAMLAAREQHDAEP